MNAGSDASPRAAQTFRDCWFLTGHTASGKTAVGLELATLLNAEIISLDSMAIYRGMDIGTAKPTAEQQSHTPHHLIDIASPVENFSAAEYLAAAAEAAEGIRSRGREPLFVGGTPLYLKSLLRGVFEGPPADWDFRREVEAEVKQVGVAALHERLNQVDPLSAAKLHPNDIRRIIRALEVYKITGQPISHLQTQFEEGLPASQCKVFVLDWPRAELHQRIEQRVQQMFAAGLVEEVRGLIDQYGELSRTASQAVGYREVIAALAADEDEASMCEAVNIRTRQFARRQDTWFRGLSECRQFPMTEARTPAAIAAEIAHALDA